MVASAESAAFQRALKAMRPWQLRDVALALAVRRARTKAEQAWAITEVFEDLERRAEATKAVDAVSRGIKRPGIIKSLLPAFDTCFVTHV